VKNVSDLLIFRWDLRIRIVDPDLGPGHWCVVVPPQCRLYLLLYNTEWCDHSAVYHYCAARYHLLHRIRTL
jgi:hypothetical protein